MKKSRKPINQGVTQLAELLRQGDLETAQSLAGSIYQQRTTVPTPAAPLLAGVTVDSALVTRTNQFLRHKAACRIAETLYNHAELASAKQWAEACDFTVNDMYTRRARVLLGDIAMAMDKDDEAIAHYTAVIDLKNRYREQIAAYDGLLELLQLSKQDDQIEPWVRHGQHKFRNGGGIEKRFLWSVSRVLRRRNHPLWREINEQIVAKTADGAKWKLKAQRELASNARKFGRYDEAEAHYAGICSQPLKSPRDLVNMHLFLVECQTKQGKDITPTLQLLQSRTSALPQSADRDYASYRIAKLYESIGWNGLADAGYGSLAAGCGEWAAAALTMQAKLAEKQGNLRRALDFYLQYSQRFQQNDRLVMQSFGSALNVATTLGNTNATEQIISAITNRALAVHDYNVQLNLALYFWKRGQHDMAGQFLERGLSLALSTLASIPNPSGRYEIHYRVLRRLSDIGNPEKVLNYALNNDSDLSHTAVASVRNEEAYFCIYFKAVSLYSAGRREQAAAEFNWLLEKLNGESKLEAVIGGVCGLIQMQSNNSQSAFALFESVLGTYPTHPWANIARLELAIAKFKLRDRSGAMRLADEIIANSPSNTKLAWIAKLHWSGVYLRGRCLKADDRVQEGEALIKEALKHEPGLYVVMTRPQTLYQLL